MLRDVLVRRVLVGPKERLLAPELLDEFVRSYVAEVTAANRERGARQAQLERERARLARQIRNLLELIKDGHGSPAMVAELREVERRHETLGAEIAAAGTPESIALALHRNLPALYRRRVEALKKALRDPATAAAAAEALRALIEAIVVRPGGRHGAFTVAPRGDLAAFQHVAADAEAAHGKTAVRLTGNGRSRSAGEVLGSWDAGTRIGLCRTRLL